MLCGTTPPMGDVALGDVQRLILPVDAAAREKQAQPVVAKGSEAASVHQPPRQRLTIAQPRETESNTYTALG